MPRPELTIRQILAWADAHYKRQGKWPNKHTPGVIPASLEDLWCNVDDALRWGHRGLPGGCSLGRLLADERGARNRTNPPRFQVAKILRWADAFQRRRGR